MTEVASATSDDVVAQRRNLEARQLSEHAYAQRRAMLAVAALTFAISWGGVRLSSIDAFGLTITTWNERYLLGFSAVVLAYLVGNFASLVQPAIVAWQADVEAFKVSSDHTVREATAMVHQGLAGIRSALEQGGASGEAITEFMAVANKFDSTLDSRVSRYARTYLELHRARLRFEFRVPVGISLTVLYLVIPRIVVLG